MALPSCLQHKYVNTETYSKTFCKDVTGTLAFNWMLNGNMDKMLILSIMALSLGKNSI